MAIRQHAWSARTVSAVPCRRGPYRNLLRATARASAGSDSAADSDVLYFGYGANMDPRYVYRARACAQGGSWTRPRAAPVG